MSKKQMNSASRKTANVSSANEQSEELQTRSLTDSETEQYELEINYSDEIANDMQRIDFEVKKEIDRRKQIQLENLRDRAMHD